MLISCKEVKTPFSAQSIVDKAIATVCSDNCEQAEISFIFRDKSYKSVRKDGNFRLERMFSDSTATYQDIVTNEGFLRYRNDTFQQIADSTALRLANSVNSVHYFAQLPFGLNDPAVNKELVGDTSIKGAPYFEVEVTFSEEGGGTDFDDVFMYWINKKTYTVDYLAYSYAVNGGGIRFREAYNPREINGIRFVDYYNYKPDTLEYTLDQLPKLFEQGALALLSKIELKNIEVNLNP